MEKILQEFMDISDEPYKWLSEYKKSTNRKLLAVYPLHVPEEIIHASGAVPFIIQRSSELITLAPLYLQSFYCDFGRSTLDLVLRGKLDFADGIVRGNACYINQGLSHIEQTKRPDIWQYDVFMPVALGQPLTKSFLRSELERFRTVMGEWTGNTITDEALWKSIKIYNENRALIRKLYELRRSKPGILRAREMQAIVKASMLMPKQEHTERLKKLLPQLEQRKPPSNGRVKLFVSGSMCEDVLPDILDFIEDLGGVIVDDDIYMGYRYVADDSNEKAATPIESLLQGYMDMIPCPTRYHPDKHWATYLVNRVKQAKAQGVVIIVVMHCEPHWYAYPHIKNRLNDAGIHHFYIESEQESLSLAKLRTKYEAFMEMVKGGFKVK